MIIEVSHTQAQIVYQPNKQANKVAREAKEAKHTHSLSLLEAYDLYTFSPFGNKLPKNLKMHSAMRISKHDLRELRSAKVAWRGVLQQMHLKRSVELVE